MTHPVTMVDVEHVVNNATRINITSNNRIWRTIRHLIWFMVIQMVLSVAVAALILGNQQQTYKQLHSNVETYTKVTESACVDIKTEMHDTVTRVLSAISSPTSSKP